MIVKQASEVAKPPGRGEVNTALGGVQSLVSVAMPLFWGWLCKSFFEGGGGPGARWFKPGACLSILIV